MSDNVLQEHGWDEARRRAEMLDGLSGVARSAAVRDATTELGVSRVTFFRMLRRYREDSRTSALLPGKPGPKQPVRPFSAGLAMIVVRHFEQLYATRRKPTLTRFWREVAADCRAAGIPPPSIRRLERWIKTQDQAVLLRRREGVEKAEARYLATPGRLEALRPLEIVQIDHTKVDLVVVDPVTRQPIGRPTLTLAIDVNTRMAVGFHLSLEAPSILSVALCLTHAVMDKSAWCLARGIPTEWPSQGLPESILVDNGGEFRSHAFQNACHEHRIGLDYRPPGTPRFGGHIERLIGTMMGAVHLIPGSTFSNIAEKADIDPEAQAVMSLAELEAYLALEITGAYHARLHRALGLSPVAAWQDRIGATLLRKPADPRQFLIDFLPRETRTLQRDGLHLFNIRYWADELRWWMGRTGGITIAYDPRNLSCVFARKVADRGGRFIDVRPADRTRPPVALWEHRAAVRALREAGRRSVDEQLIFSTILAQRLLVDQAVKTTKAVRRQILRRGSARFAPMIEGSAVTVTSSVQQPSDEHAPLQLPYFDVEEWDDR